MHEGALTKGRAYANEGGLTSRCQQRANWSAANQCCPHNGLLLHPAQTPQRTFVLCVRQLRQRLVAQQLHHVPHLHEAAGKCNTAHPGQLHAPKHNSCRVHAKSCAARQRQRSLQLHRVFNTATATASLHPAHLVRDLGPKLAQPPNHIGQTLRSTAGRQHGVALGKARKCRWKGSARCSDQCQFCLRQARRLQPNLPPRYLQPHLGPEGLHLPLHGTRHSVQQVVVRLLAHGGSGVDDVGQRLRAKVVVPVCSVGAVGGLGRITGGALQYSTSYRHNPVKPSCAKTRSHKAQAPRQKNRPKAHPSCRCCASHSAAET